MPSWEFLQGECYRCHGANPSCLRTALSFSQLQIIKEYFQETYHILCSRKLEERLIDEYLKIMGF